MSTEYFVDTQGRYLGAFVDGALPPAGAIHAPYAPTDARQIWNATTQAWSAPPAPVPPMPTPREWLERLDQGKQAAIAAAARSNDTLFLWFMKASGSATIDVTLPETIAGVEALVTAGVLSSADQAVLLA
jgi:hypothetical protein